jgi:hypothetical protein
MPRWDIEHWAERAANASLIAAAPEMDAEISRLRAINAELVKALHDVLPYAKAAIGLPEALWPHDSVILCARAALAKAERK